MKKYAKIIIVLLAVIVVLSSTLIYGISSKSKSSILSGGGVFLAATGTTVLSAIIMNSSTDTIDSANLSRFYLNVGDVQMALDVAAVTAKGMQAAQGFTRTDAQVYNLIAKGSIESIDEEELENADWLYREEASKVLCTKINPEKAEKILEIELPIMKVEDENGKAVEANYYVTQTGEVFIWPPFEHENEFYVSSDTTVVDKSRNPITSKNASQMFEDDFILQIDGLEIPVGEYLK